MKYLLITAIALIASSSLFASSFKLNNGFEISCELEDNSLCSQQIEKMEEVYSKLDTIFTKAPKAKTVEYPELDRMIFKVGTSNAFTLELDVFPKFTFNSKNTASENIDLVLYHLPMFQKKSLRLDKILVHSQYRTYLYSKELNKDNYKRFIELLEEIAQKRPSKIRNLMFADFDPRASHLDSLGFYDEDIQLTFTASDIPLFKKLELAIEWLKFDTVLQRSLSNKIRRNSMPFSTLEKRLAFFKEITDELVNLDINYDLYVYASLGNSISILVMNGNETLGDFKLEDFDNSNINQEIKRFKTEVESLLQ